MIPYILLACAATAGEATNDLHFVIADMQIGEVRGFAGFLHVLLFAAKVKLGFVDPQVSKILMT